MYRLPDHEIPVRVMGIDPGSNMLGVSILDYHLADKSVVLVDARTFQAAQDLREYKLVADVHGEHIAKLMSIRDSLSGYMRAWIPYTVASESPYMGRFPAAYRALCNCMMMITETVIAHDPYMPLHLFDPMTVKAAVGVTAKGYRNKAALAKEHVKAAVLGLPLDNPSGIDTSKLDEHSIDAIAVAMARIKLFNP